MSGAVENGGLACQVMGNKWKRTKGHKNRGLSKGGHSKNRSPSPYSALCCE